MKMKKLLTLTLAATMVAGTSLTAAAGAPGFNPPGQEDQTIDFDSSDENQSPGTADVPVYGYVGPDAVLIDPDPTEPGSTPEPTDPDDVEYQINVSVPVKILWAVFESDVDTATGIGEVTSPDYYIRNNSEQLDVTVTATSFTAKSGSQDNTYVDKNWVAGEELTLITQNGYMRYGVELNQTNILLGNLPANQQMEFMVEGKLDVDAVDAAYRGDNGASIMQDAYDNALYPDYDLVLTITAL